MAILSDKIVSRQVPVRSRCLLGRHASCDVRAESPKVSANHAMLRWVGEFWEIQDLGSRNGTFVGDRRLEIGEHARLDEGMTFSLSRSAATFELCDTSPPGAAAYHKKTGTWTVSSGGVLVLPIESRPVVTVFATGDGQWLVEREDDVHPAVDREEVVVEGEIYTLDIPAPSITTLQSHALSPLLESIRLRLGVTLDEEQVEATLFHAGQRLQLPPRRYHYLLLTLARAWLAEEGLPLSLRGWIDREDLCQKLALDVGKLNVEIYRARKQLAALGVRGAAGLVERRPGTHEIRIGVRDLEVVRL